MTAIKQLLAPSEAEFRASVVHLATEAGWHIAYFGHQRGGSYAYDGEGFPPLVLVGHRGVIFATVKTQHVGLTPAEEEWAGRLCTAGASWYLWRPSDYPAIEGVLTTGMGS